MDPRHESNAASAPGRFPPGLFGFTVVIGIVFVLALGTLVYMTAKKNTRPVPGFTPDAGTGTSVQIITPRPNNNPLEPDQFVDGFFIPPFALVDQDEQRVTNEVFRGRITVIDFFFTHCPFICPAMSGRFAQMVKELKDVPEAQFLSFSVDPVHDTPARLREYATGLEADTARWRFLTGSKEVTWKILSDGLKWGVEERPEQMIKLPTGNEMANIRHPGWFALIGPDSRILAIYKYDVEEDQRKLVERVRAVAARMKKG